ncbi:hypothetical protein [Bordetella ansorpii]|nr:hypothetical protein [Bordetella ansorpii]
MPFRSLRALAAACAASLLVAGCGGGDEDSADTAQARDGSAQAQTPIVAPPTQGCDVAQGGEAVRPPVLNTQLDCAP